MRTKRVLWLTGIGLAAVVGLTLGSTLWELHAVRSAIRLSVELHEGKNVIELALCRGNYVYQIAAEPMVELGTIFGRNTNIVTRTSVTSGQTSLIYESTNQTGAFGIGRIADCPVRLVVHLDFARGPVYLSFRRGL